MRYAISFFVAILFALPVHAGSLRATPDTLTDALGAIRRDKTIDTLILEAGVYGGPDLLVRDVGEGAAALTIRPADGAAVIFDGGQRIIEAQKQGNLYSIEGRTAAMWEADTRTRYVHVADKRTVAAEPGTFANVDGRILFHTSDGASPASHEVGFAVNNGGLFIHRPNTTVQGITFRNFLSGTWSSGVWVNASNVTVRDCSTVNARAGFFVYGGIQNVTIEDCRADDVGCGLYAMGTDMQIHRNRFTKIRDTYQVPTYWQDDNGIQCYYPADGGVITGNVVVGFNYGIYCKCRGEWRVEHNTVIKSKSGLYRSTWKPGNVYRYNIVSGTQWPFHNPQTIHSPVTVDHNLVWDPRELVLFHSSLDGPASVGNKANIIANPRFVNAANGDYRVLPTSPAVTLAPDDRPLGALPAINEQEDNQPPIVALSLTGAAKRNGSTGEEFFERDPWIGGGRQHSGEHFKPNGDADYVVPSTKIDLVIDADDAAGTPTLMRMKFNDDPWGDETPLDVRPAKLSLPHAGINTIAVRVADDKGNWSAPTSLRIRVADSAPDLDGDVVAHTSDNGVVLSFRTDHPALVTVTYGDDNVTAAPPQRIARDWDVMAGGDRVVEWTEPTTVHHVPILTPNVAAGQAYTYRIHITDLVGNARTTAPGSFTVQGKARTLRVGKDGADREGAEKFATIQYAVDRALPGDTITIEPGVYLAETFIGHGGTQDAPITLRGAAPGQVVLDGARRLHSLLRIEASPHIHIEDLELRWTTLRGSAIYAADSPGLQVRRCKIWNKHFGHDWGEGYAVFTHRCPNTLFDHNLIFRQEVGLYLLQSPRATITHNTAVQCLLGGLMLSVQSAPGTTVMNNSFTFNGNDQMYIEALDPSEIETFQSDYNNFATELRPSNEGGDMSVKAPHPYLKQGSKAIFMGPLGRYRDMDSWRKAHGQDQHSLFIDPNYVDPVNHDFTLQPGSPNLAAGSEGTSIGAFGTK